MMHRGERAPCGPDFAVMQGVDLSITGGQQRRTVLDHVDLAVRQGELLALVGANGAGKSCLLRCLAGVWQPTAGRITIGGFDRVLNDLDIRRFTAYLPPDPGLPRLSIRENIRLMAESYGVDERVYRERQDALLRMFDLKERQDTSSRGLSKGETKKACLAAVLVSGASFYVLDEPFTGGLDPRGYEALRRVIESLAANRSITVVFATQFLDLAAALADRIAVLNSGRILAVGALDELRQIAGLDTNAGIAEVYAQLASKDTKAPVQDFLGRLELAP